jgi:hypothetical protein
MMLGSVSSANRAVCTGVGFGRGVRWLGVRWVGVR